MFRTFQTSMSQTCLCRSRLISFLAWSVGYAIGPNQESNIQTMNLPHSSLAIRITCVVWLVSRSIRPPKSNVHSVVRQRIYINSQSRLERMAVARFVHSTSAERVHANHVFKINLVVYWMHSSQRGRCAGSAGRRWLSAGREQLGNRAACRWFFAAVHSRWCNW